MDQPALFLTEMGYPARFRVLEAATDALKGRIDLATIVQRRRDARGRTRSFRDPVFGMEGPTPLWQTTGIDHRQAAGAASCWPMSHT